MIVLSITLLSVIKIVAQQYKGEIDSTLLPNIGDAHYQPEYTLDKPLNAAAWATEKPGMHAAFGSEDALYFRTEVPAINIDATTWNATGWKNERLNTQIVVWSPDTLQQVRFEINDLKNKNGKLLSSKNISLNKVEYVIANFPYGSDKPDCSPSPYTNGFLMPDRFVPMSEGKDRFDVPGKTVRAVWLCLNIPVNADAGMYNGTIEVNAVNYHTTLHVNITVQHELLPQPHDWHYRLDLWQNPWVIADYYHVQPWGKEHIELLKKHLKLYADAGGTFITTYGVHSPWGDNEHAIEGGMIDWIKQKNGTWKFDYSIFDTYVQLAMSLGIDKAITVYTPLPYNNRLRYKDAGNGNYVYVWWPPTSDSFRIVWNAFLNDLKIHLEKKGWLNKTYIGLNESELSQTLAAIKVVKENSKQWKITYAGDWHKELDTLIDDYSSVFEYEPSLEEVKARAAKGFTSTYYVCCHPAKPNTFLFSPPIEGRWISWFVAAHGYNGFLRWAYDSWTADPLRDARYGSWAAGDCYLIYPGANSCIRFEKLREGIVDYEKIRLLKDLAAKSTDSQIKKLMSALDAHLKTFNNEKTFDEEKLKNDIATGKQLIDEISGQLNEENK